MAAKRQLSNKLEVYSDIKFFLEFGQESSSLLSECTHRVDWNDRKTLAAKGKG